MARYKSPTDTYVRMMLFMGFTRDELIQMHILDPMKRKCSNKKVIR